MKQKSNLKVDLAVVLGMVVLAIVTILYFEVRFLTSTILFFVPTSAYLLFKNPRCLKRTLAASFLFGIVFGFIFDFIAEFNKAWAWAPEGQLVFAHKILGVVPIDVMIWYFLWVFVVVVFYEHFLEHEQDDTISHNYKYGLLPALATGVGMIFIFLSAPEVLSMRYSYLVLGCLAFLPFFLLIVKKPLLFFKFIKVAPFFFFLFLSFELTALHLNQWHFPGEYIGHVNLGTLKFPFEEFFFWILMSSTVVLSYYELYVDDER